MIINRFVAVNNLQNNATNLDMTRAVFVNKSVKLGIDELLDNIFFRFVETAERQWITRVCLEITPLTKPFESRHYED